MNFCNLFQAGKILSKLIIIYVRDNISSNYVVISCIAIDKYICLCTFCTISFTLIIEA